MGKIMPLKQNFQLLAQYNQWMNTKIYDVISSISSDEISKDRGAFFGSILGTLNHILVGDLAWLNRFKRHPATFVSLEHIEELPIPSAINQILYSDFVELRKARKKVDDVFVALCEEVDDNSLETALPYKNMRGEKMNKRFSSVLQHVFNHQTHHRGQLTTLLSQMGIDFGVTDLITLIENEC